MIHKEGTPTIMITIVFIAILHAVIYFAGGNEIITRIGYALSGILLLLILQFFRNPSRIIPVNENHILSPADGKVVAIEEVFEDEYFHDKRIQVSIFMSPINVHANRYPVSGKIAYYKYHPGKYLVAWHPKSSTENERTTVCLTPPHPQPLSEGEGGISPKERGVVMFRQIAGGLARRIVFYGKENEMVKQGEQCGFIKFGSRVDVFLPLDSKINIKLKDTVTGGVSVIAEICISP